MDSKVTRFLFWVAFVAFLGSSIPHVAWVYDQFEQGNQDVSLAGVHVNGWYCLSILIAVGIDALVAWLSFQLAVGKGKSNACMTWTFILTLSSLSWYCNWIYSVAHSPAAHVNVWAIALFWGLTTTGTLTSWLVSAFPVFSIGYTFMLSRMNENQIDPDMLRAELERKKTIADIRKEFANDESGVSVFLKKRIDEAADVTAFAKSRLRVQVADQQTDTEADIVEDQEMDIESDMQTDVQMDTGMDINPEITEDLQPDTPPSLPIVLKPRRKQIYISVEDAILATGYNSEYLKKKVREGAIKTKVGSKDVLLISSLNDYLVKNKKQPLIVERDTDELEASQSGDDESVDVETDAETESVNGHKKVTQPLQGLVELEA
jgi:hypothetical protein